jgi:hypothetical protein
LPVALFFGNLVETGLEMKMSDNPNKLEGILANPEAHAWRVLAAMLPYGVEAPTTDDKEIDHEALNDLVVHAVTQLLEHVEDENIRIYRAISVPADWEPETVGVYWTFRRDRAIPYNGNTSDFIVLEATVALNDINLYETIVLNMDLTEDEVLLLKSAEVHVERAWHMGGQPSHAHLENRTFGAGIPVHIPALRI